MLARFFAATLVFALVSVGLLPASALAQQTSMARGAGSVSLAGGSAKPVALQRTALKQGTSTSEIGVHIQSISPAVAGSSDDVSAQVQVSNTGSTPLKGAQARFSVGLHPVQSLDAQSMWMAQASSTTGGQVSQGITKATTTTVPDIAAHQVATVSMKIPASDFEQINYALANLPARVEVTSGGTTRAATNSFVSWADTTASLKPMSASVIVPITLPSDPKLFTATGSERLGEWKKAIGPGSPIDQLLSNDTDVPLTWLIDPAVLSPPTPEDSTLPATAEHSASDNSSGAGASGSPSNSSSSSSSPTSNSSGNASNSSSPSSGASSTSGASNGASAGSSASSTDDGQSYTTVQQLADRLIEKLRNRSNKQQIWFTPYGDPDLAALTASNRPANAAATLHRMLARKIPANLTSLSSTVVAAPTAPMDAASTARLASAWQSARGTQPLLVAPNATFSTSAEPVALQSVTKTSSGLVGVGYDAALSRTLSDPSLSDGDSAALASAASLGIYQEAPALARSLTVMASRATISPSRLTSVLNSLSLPWVTPAALSTTPKAKATTGVIPQIATRSDGVWPAPSVAAINANFLSNNDSTLTNLGRMANIVTNGGDIVPAWSGTLDQVASTRWRGHPNGVDTLEHNAADTVADIPSHISISPAKINFFTDSGRITVTVKNELQRSVDGISLQLFPRSYIVHFRHQPGPFTIGAGGQTGIRVDTQAQSAGWVSVESTLHARNGVALGDGETRTPALEINARPTATWIYYALGIVALLIFCYGLYRGRSKGTRRRDELERDIKL